MRIRFNQFAGELPRYSEYALPENNAVSAINCDFSNGFVKPLCRFESGDTLSLTGHDISAIYLWRTGGSQYWLRFANAVNVIRSPIADNAYARIYWSGDTRSDGDVLYSYTPAVYTGGTEYPVNYYKLGIPRPTIAPTAVVSGTPPDNPNDEQRFYVYTYVGKLGEESPPSPPSDALIVANDGSTINLSGITLDTSASTGREIVTIRIYRTLVGSSAASAEFLFVADIAYTETTYSDTKSSIELGEAIPSLAWYPPRTGMKGLGLTSYGVAYGFLGKIICQSDINRPYAWPRSYELTSPYDVVAIGHYDSYQIVATTARPVILTGIDPSSLSQMELPIVEACVSARSMVSMGYCAIYASPNGLVMSSGGSASLVTDAIMSWRQWSAINPSSIHAYQHRDRYLFFWKVDETHKGGFFFNPRNPNDGFVSFSQWFVAGYRDTETDTLWLIDSNKQLWKLDDTSNTPLQMTWKSKTVKLPRVGMMVAGRVIADDYSDLTINVYADGALHHTRAVADDSPFSMPRNRRKMNWQVEVVNGSGTVREIAIAESRNEIGAA